MKPATVAVRTHSGWGAVVALSGDSAHAEILARSRVSVIGPKMKLPFQPYHRAAKMKLSDAAIYLAKCASECESVAITALGQIADELRARGYHLVGSAVLLGSGRPMPPLPRILAAHPMLHTAEGIFFRQVFHTAFERLNFPVTGFRELDLDEHLKIAFGRKVPAIRRKIENMGKSLGPPWTADQKLAALAAWITLARR